ncbi:GNAT family N-acetyltransferase [Nocardia sp. NPDC051833]|uniref:GNAT family N-acetyltransferase n=1 Tax=Nocardia sp. NPDC051833 TaxID=3155674 RepID=UPI0034412A18
MSTDSLLTKARLLWEDLAAAPAAFGADGEVSVVVSPHASTCPPGWIGIVVLGGQAVVTVPDSRTAEEVRTALARLSIDHLTDPAQLGTVLPIAETIGPAALAYVDQLSFQPPHPAAPIEHLRADNPDLRALESEAGHEDASEAGLDALTSPAFVLRSDEKVVAAAGYEAWPIRTAHLSILTAPAHRGRGLARATASAAVAHALAAGLFPQWRARVPQSRAVARALGFRELGAQLCVRLDHRAQRAGSA